MLGRVMYQNCWKKPAPSMRAASYWFSDTDWREAYSSRNTRDVLPHVDQQDRAEGRFVSMNQLNTAVLALQELADDAVVGGASSASRGPP